jgi:hypothetical protein
MYWLTNELDKNNSFYNTARLCCIEVKQFFGGNSAFDPAIIKHSL